MSKRKTKKSDSLPAYRVPEKYQNKPIVVVLEGKPVALGRDVVRKGKPPQIDMLVREATPEQYIELAQNNRYGIELI